MKLIILSCEIMYREISYCVAKSKNIVDVKFLQKGLHDIGQEEMSKTLQAEINQVPKDKYEAILLGYALCSNGIKGLTTEENTLVVPRAHDCITLLLGSKEKYSNYMAQHPGTFFRSTGWLERNQPEIGEDGKVLHDRALHSRERDSVRLDCHIVEKIRRLGDSLSEHQHAKALPSEQRCAQQGL